MPQSWTSVGKQLPRGPMRWNLRRALTDNDLGWKVDRIMGPSKDAVSRSKAE